MAAAGGGGGGGGHSPLPALLREGGGGANAPLKSGDGGYISSENEEDNSPLTDEEMASIVSYSQKEKGVLIALREALKEFDEIKFQGKQKSGVLTISFITPDNGIYYDTFFGLVHVLESNGNILTLIDNGCIKLWITDVIKENNVDIQSKIQKNDGVIPCFEPRLDSYPGVVTTTDVLQILKIKLNCLFPSITHPNQIKISDKAYIDGLHMTPYRILRGGKPFYSKYGFKSEEFDDAMQTISEYTAEVLQRVLYQAPEGEEIGKEHNEKSYFTLLPILLPGLEINKDDLLINVMKNISPELDAEYNLSRFLFFSLFPRLYEDFSFYYDSPEWNAVKGKVQIFAFKLDNVVHQGGKRRLIKRKTIRKKKVKRKSRKGKGKK